MDPQPIPAVLTESSLTGVPALDQALEDIVTVATALASESDEQPATLPAAEAITRAAQDVPEKVEDISQDILRDTDPPTQPFLPHTRPAFDVQAALDAIEDQELAASDAERAYLSAAEKAKTLRKLADGENSKLRSLIRELNKRRHDARYEPKDADGEEESGVARLGAADEPNPSTDSVSDVPVLGDLGAEGTTVEDWQYCNEQHNPPMTDGATATADPLGSDAPPASEDPAVVLPALTALQNRLRRAGADIDLDTIAAWTLPQSLEAAHWAEDQIAANEAADQIAANEEAADDGRARVSVQWPTHVSQAHHANTEPSPRRPRQAVPRPPGARTKATTRETASRHRTRQTGRR